MGTITLKTLGLSLLVTLGVFTACNRVGDEYCDVGTSPDDTTDQCPYGPPGGPGSHSDACPEITVNTNAAGCATSALTWAGSDGIWYTQLRQSCSTGGCHEANAGSISLPFNDASAAYKTLTAYNKQGLGLYISDSDATRTWILCNLQRLKTGGDGMPLGRDLPAGSFEKVKAWAECGEKLGTDKGGGTGMMDAGGGG